MKRIVDLSYKYKYIFSKKERCSFIVLIIMLAFGSVLETATVYMMLPFMYSIIEPEKLMEQGMIKKISEILEINGTTDLIIFMSLILGGIYIIKGGYTLLSVRIEYKYLEKSRVNMCTQIFSCIIRKPYQYFLDNNTAEIQKICQNDVNRLYNWLSALFQIFYELLTTILIMGVLFIQNPKLVIFAIVFLTFIAGAINRVVSGKIRKSGKIVQQCVADLLACIAQSTGAIKEIKVNRKQNYFIYEYVKSVSAYVKAENNNTVYCTIPRVIIETVCMATIFIYMAIISSIGENINEMLPILGIFSIAAVRLIPVVNRINNSINSLKYNELALDSVYQTLQESDIDTNIAVYIKDDIVLSDEREKIEINQGIEVSHVLFRYEDAKKNLYNDISIKIKSGQSVAFIGTTGSGKTTLADIILGLHKPNKGIILVDGKNIFENQEWWSKCIGYIPQNIYLCDSDIKRNIAFGIPDKQINRDRVWKCLEEAQLKEFVEKLPNGIDSLVGENGVRMSGGQRQRLGIARALYNDPPFLVMDEATSALDNETEAAIIEAINKLAGRKTLLIIAHRLSTIKECDVIYKIEDGEARIIQKIG